MAKCIAFDMEDASEAFRHFSGGELVRCYGNKAYGNSLYTWDAGERCLVKCKKCGGYILIQYSEFHALDHSDDKYYDDYFPVESEEEADELNRKYNGWEIERQFGKRYLIRDNDDPPHWS